MLNKATVKYIQSLQHKKFRESEGVFVAEGHKVVTELLHNQHFSCRQLFALPSWIEKLEPVVQQQVQAVMVEVADFELEKLAAYSTANQVVAVFEQSPLAETFALQGLTLMLDDIQDPGNFGTIIRTADWFGIRQVVCSQHTVDMYNPKVVQSTMASLGRVHIHYTDLVELLATVTDRPILAATLSGNHMTAFKPMPEGILLIGNESKGIGADCLKRATDTISIPRIGSAESLNAAVATGILLHHLTQA
jgi:TrmH family RNA methyltransferase